MILLNYMTLCNDIIKPNCSYTYYHEALNQYSYVDYFLISNMTNLLVLDEMVNLLPLKISEIKCAANLKSAPVKTKQKRLRWDLIN